ncbi:SDR family NAD(P)-dependent oxidoreductase [Erythrobacter sp. BLCC-B19]|uniref:SDR family NAD(P)-dependent oxidoreductase n=1 Tax=Erythrobacter sp. BLCC-B19 TaxID=3025315 RepID=UPI002361F99A|nr:SDR family NAD(P)-dependent oxidoreductase [Erythrobacter sp. BLCC-B19]WDA39770.1 SDR family NAD(P)-dependent oxidoreductase [Erythrobacter sp. BLCC-B19]
MGTGSAAELAGKVAVVTGASRGLGKAIATLFAAEGARVVLIDLKPHWAQAAAADIGHDAIGLGADVSDRAAITAALDAAARECGRIDVLVNNAMWNSYDLIPDITPEIFNRMTGVGLGGIVWGIQAALPHMQSGGSIINIGSMAGRLGSAGALLYAAVKAGVDGLTRSASVELGARGIRVNAIAPSTVATEGVMAILSPEQLERRISQTPMARLGTADDIAQTALWLAGARSGFVTGQSLAVDGGIGHTLQR